MNIMTNDYHWQTNGFHADRRMSYQKEVLRQTDRRMPVKKVDQGCITAPTKSEGSRFHAKG